MNVFFKMKRKKTIHKSTKPDSFSQCGYQGNSKHLFFIILSMNQLIHSVRNLIIRSIKCHKMMKTEKQPRKYSD